MKKYNAIIGLGGIVLIIAALIWYSISQIWGVENWILLLLGVAATGHFLFYYFRNRQKELSKRSMKQGSNAAVQIVVVLMIAAMLAFVTTRRHYRADLTENNLYSLSDQTDKLLENLDKPVEVKAFFRSTEQQGAKDMLDEYNYRSSQFSYELIDPDEKPQLVKQFGVTQYNTLAVEYGAKIELVTELSEVNLTNAIIKVTREQDKAIYFTSGHGERSINDEQVDGFKMAADAIQKENHLVREFNLVREGAVPDSATVVAIIGAKSPFFPAELDSLEKYVENGGKLMIMLDPDSPQDLRDFAARYKIAVGNDMVIDASGFGQLLGAGPGMPLVQTYATEHAITKGFSVMTFYPYASSVTPMDDKGGWEMTELIKTTEQSWGETDYASGEVSFDEDSDKKGPVTLGVVAEKKSGDKKAIVTVFGDSDFAKNGYFSQQGNSNLFLNTINFMAEEEDLISIRPKKVDDRRLTLTQADVSSIFYLVVIAIPLILIITGVTVFIKRNRA